MHALQLQYESTDGVWFSPEDFQKLDLHNAYVEMILALPTPTIAALSDDDEQLEQARQLATGMATAFVQDVDTYLANPAVHTVTAVAP